MAAPDAENDAHGNGRKILAVGAGAVIVGALCLVLGWVIFGASLLIVGGILMHVGNEKLAR